MKEKRRHERRHETLQMSVTSSTGVSRTLVTRDVSDGGIFLLALAPDQMSVGTEVTLSPARYAGGAKPPTIKGRVSRVSDQGMGIEFMESSFTAGGPVRPDGVRTGDKK